MRIQILLLCLVILVGCQPAVSIPLTTQPESNNPEFVNSNPDISGQTLETSLNGYQVVLTIPNHWETMITKNGIVLAELYNSIQDVSNLDGMLVYLFMPTEENFPSEIFDQRDNVNVAQNVLDYVVRLPNYVGDAQVSDPVAFEWDGYDAAYYTLNSGDGTLTLLIFAVLDDNKLVGVNVTVPAQKGDYLREYLPLALQRISIDEMVLSGQSLDTLPNPLSFPPLDVEIASENTPTNP